MKAATDPEQIARHVHDARRGSQPAFAWLYRTFAPLVHAIHLGVAPRARAEELTQETFAVAFARLEQLRDPARFGPWVAMVARRNRPSAGIGESQWDESADVPWPGASPESTAEAVAALQAIRRLPEAYRETLILRLVEGMSGPEIAVLTGLTPQSVRVNLHRGMVKLRLALGIAVEPEENADDRQA
ncbi:MAG: sigma-70 family RNA polymerase sigma factor [Xanthomonadales bacterium]|nr:sigma-70 family RNA polymerase sigma factor [Xanthomonadaceae bacterium]MBN8223263.1 sigma-70 family RNA polymerase sigma factor [Xanthomonadales bacterium]HRF82882.1 sigma-70 family RNA polymerase sigma factor [Pseudoxanthomonas sp.]